MACEIKFDEWLEAKLLVLNPAIDCSIYVSYIADALAEDDNDADAESLVELLQSLDINENDALSASEEIKWQFQAQKKLEQSEKIAFEKDIEVSVSSATTIASPYRMIFEQNRLLTVNPRGANASEKKNIENREEVLQKFSTVSSSESDCDSDEEADLDKSLPSNSNRDEVRQRERQQRERQKTESESKRLQDKAGRDAQKKKSEERKEREKQRTVKGERRR